jgi:hypothetical protein
MSETRDQRQERLAIKVSMDHSQWLSKEAQWWLDAESLEMLIDKYDSGASNLPLFDPDSLRIHTVSELLHSSNAPMHVLLSAWMKFYTQTPPAEREKYRELNTKLWPLIDSIINNPATTKSAGWDEAPLPLTKDA